MSAGIAIAVGLVPDRDLAGVEAVEVYERAGTSTRYRLRYTPGTSGGDLLLVGDSRLDGSGSNLSILLPQKSSPVCLVRGPVEGQRMELDHSLANPALDVLGVDRSAEMDRKLQSKVWDQQTDTDVVAAICSQYGFLVDLEKTSTRHHEKKHTLVQRETDLSFVRRLARRNGFHFWIRSDAATDTAHFRSPDTSSSSVAKLAINRTDRTIDRVEIEWDLARPSSVEAAQLDLNTLGLHDGATQVSPVRPLGGKTLQQLTAGRSMALSGPVDDVGALKSRAEGALEESGWFVRAHATTSVDTLGKVLRPYDVVELAGVGGRHSGDYMVWAVRHLIDSSAHRMELELARNAWSQ